MNELNYPTYQSYKDSGIPGLGEIPAGWEVLKLRSLFKPSSERNRADLQLLSVVREKGVIVRDVLDQDSNHNYIPDDLSNYKRVKKGDFAINKMKAWQGSYGVSEFDGIVSPAYYVFEIKSKRISPEFINRALRSKAYISLFGSASDGVRVGQWDLSLNRMKDIPFIHPPLSEQERIVAFLDRKTAEVDEAIAKKQRLIELLNEQKAILINRAVTRGLNPDAPLKDSGVSWIGEIPAHWQTLPMRWIVKIATGGKDTVDRIDDGKYPFFVRSEKVERINSYSMDCEAVLTSGDGAGVGKIFHHVNGKFDFHQRVYAFTEFKSVTGRYFYYFLSSLFGYQMAQNMAKSTVDSVRLPFLKEMIFCIPPISEQNHIVAILDNKIESINEFGNGVLKSIEKLQEYKQILIAHAVTGKIRVPEA